MTFGRNGRRRKREKGNRKRKGDGKGTLARGTREHRTPESRSIGKSGKTECRKGWRIRVIEYNSIRMMIDNPEKLE